jgi:hypothetical protein
MAATLLARLYPQASLIFQLNLDGVAAAANGSSKIRSLACKMPAVKENPSNALADGMNLSSRRFHHSDGERRA